MHEEQDLGCNFQREGSIAAHTCLAAFIMKLFLGYPPQYPSYLVNAWTRHAQGLWRDFMRPCSVGVPTSMTSWEPKLRKKKWNENCPTRLRLSLNLLAFKMFSVITGKSKTRLEINALKSKCWPNYWWGRLKCQVGRTFNPRKDNSRNFFFLCSSWIFYFCILYNVNEIAPYSTGITEFTIPYEKVQSLINFE